jgi:hypothetical protein
MKILKFTLLSFVVLAALLSCASSGRPIPRDIPDFYLNPPVAEDAIYGVGDARMSNLSMSRTMALSRARDDVARQVEVLVKNAITDYAEQAGAGRTTQTINFAETISRQLVEVSLRGLRTVEVAAGKDGTVYALVEYSSSSFMDEASGAFERNEDAAFAEFKAGQALDRLNAELENNPPQAGGN